MKRNVNESLIRRRVRCGEVFFVHGSTAYARTWCVCTTLYCSAVTYMYVLVWTIDKWTSTHGDRAIWARRSRRISRDMGYPKPRGRPPKNASGENASWDECKGEWSGVEAKATGSPKPRGRPPKGQTWDAATGEWSGGGVAKPAKTIAKKPKKPAVAKPKKPKKAAVEKAAVPGSPQPRGRPPAGKKWDSVKGEWVEGKGVPRAIAKKPASKAKPMAKEAAAAAKPAAKKAPRPRGRPPKGKSWNANKGMWVAGPSLPPEK